MLNPYAAPKARVEDPSVAAQGQLAFFPVGLPKLVVMSLATLNLYSLYWFYRNWKCVQRLDDAKLLAPVRAFFYPLTSYWLFRRIREHAAATQVGASLHAGLLAIGLFVLSALWRLPDPWWLATFLSFLPLVAVQAVVNRINRKLAPRADPNRRLRGWNILALAVGVPVFVLSIIGAFL